MPEEEKVEALNVNKPGSVTRVNAAKFGAMKRALHKALPLSGAGLTQDEMFDAVLPYLPEDLFPGGETAGWWVKSVQLDGEARGEIERIKGRPTRWRRTK